MDLAEAWAHTVVLHARVEHELAAALQGAHRLGLSDYRALCELTIAPDGELRMTELAAAVGLNQSTVTRLVARLESAGLTERTICADDRRGVHTKITAAGRQRHAEADPTYRETLRTSVAAIASDSPAMRKLVTALSTG